MPTSQPASTKLRHASDRAYYDAFISYSRRDKPFVQQLHAALSGSQYRVWVDWDDIPPVADWRQEIDRGIEAAHNFVFVISPHSTSSAVCLEEIEQAVRCGKRLLPIVRTEVSYDVVHSELAKLNWIFCQEKDDFQVAFDKLVRAIVTDLDFARTHTRLLTQAREWDIRGRDRSFLLRGSGLKEAQDWLRRGANQQPMPTDLHRAFITTSQQDETQRLEAELRLRKMTPQQLQNRQALLSKVRHYWVRGVLEPSLHERQLLGLALDYAPQAVDHPWNLADTLPILSTDSTIVSVFDQLGAGRSLLILGEPGAGKTTTLLELTQELVERAETSLDCPIPVVFNLSSWGKDKPPIVTWLVNELNQKYQVPIKIGGQWIQEQQLLLLFDGLDEVRASAQEACVTALNAFQQEYSPEMVVACRIQDYSALSQRLRFQSAVLVRSLTPQQIDEYLDQAGTELKTLRLLLRHDASLRELAKSPLMLSTMILTYHGATLTDSAMLNVGDRRKQLFDAYIERMFQRRGTERYSRVDTMHWLVWLAKRLVDSSQTIFLIEEIQPSWLQTAFQKRRYVLGVRAVVGACTGLYIGLLSGMINYDPSVQTQLARNIPETFFGFSSNVLLGLVFGIIQGIGWGAIAGGVTGLLYRVRSAFLLGTVGAVIFCLMTYLAKSLHLLNSYGLNLLDAVIFGVIFGAVMFRVKQQAIESVDTVQWSWSKALRRGLLGLGAGLGSGLGMLLLRQSVIGLGLRQVVCPVDRPIPLNSLLVNFLCKISLNAWEMAIGVLSLGIFVGLLIGLMLGFKRISEVDQRNTPNQGIQKSIKNALLLSTLGSIVAGILSGTVWWLYSQFPEAIWWIHYGNPQHQLDGIIFAVMIGAMVGGISGLVGGEDSGLVFCQHVILRIILFRSRFIPWNYAQFLNYATERTFLQKVGGGYMFHRLLLEHFAQMKRS